MLVSMSTESVQTDADRIVAFLNSHHLPDADDALADERADGWIAAWLGGTSAEQGEPTEQVHERGLRELRELREGLRQFAAANNGQPVDQQQIDRAAVSLASSPLWLDPGDLARGPRLLASGTATVHEQARAAVAEAYFTARIGTDWLRVKACASPDCRYAYVDTSRNRSRRWCEMAACGNRAKNRAWRERQTPA